MSTDALIAKLAEEARPLQPLKAPLQRSLKWLALSLIWALLIGAALGFRADIILKFTELRFAVEQIAALTTGFTAATAAFATVVPGRSKKYFLLPILPLAIWLGSLAAGCVIDLAHSPFHVPKFHADWICFPGIALVGFVPGILIVLMLRLGAPLFPTASMALAGLAVAGIGDFGFRLFHDEDGVFVVLVWQLSAVIAVTTIAALSGRLVLRWPLTQPLKHPRE